MDKVKVSKEVAKSLRFVKEELWPNGDHWKIVRDHVLSHANFRVEDLDPLNSLPLDILIKALYIGYEVERTPEDTVRERYNHYLSSEDRKYRGMGIGIKEAIEILGIKIEGVNT